jgi:hypothetical protein
LGAYVLTGSDGSFSISGDYTCTPGQQVYLYALGGDPGLGTGANAAAGLMAALGSCPTGGNFMSGTSLITNVMVNEVSTVAAAYAMAGFATDATHVGSSGTALALTGIANAFANAANLETIGTGVALATTPAGNGTVPQAEINTLANILAACVNSNGAGSACTTLFANATADGTTTGTQPTDTATAAINIAHNPENVWELYGLGTASPPFTPGLSGQPHDWTISLTYTGGGMSNPQAIAIDAQGNAWLANEGTSTGISGNLEKLSPLGAVLSGSGGFTATFMDPLGVAIDASGNAWVAAQNPYEFAGSGQPFGSFGSPPWNGGGSVAIDASGNAWFAGGDLLNAYSSGRSQLFGGTLSGYGLAAEGPSPLSIAIDGSGSAWVANYNATVTEASSSGSSLSGWNEYWLSGCCFSAGMAIAIDSHGNVWLAAPDQLMSILELSHTGAPLYGRGWLYNGIPTAVMSVAIDGADHVWFVGGGIAELSNSGAFLTLPLLGYTSGTLGPSSSPYALALDGSGDVWVANSGPAPTYSGGVSEFIGAATPVITPIVAGLPVTPTADGSSKLGTRP